MKRLMLTSLLLLAACMPTPIAPPAPRTGTPVTTSAGKTWDAVIDQFAERNISIRTIDRSSGIIVAESVKVGSNDTSLADCGKTLGVNLVPTDATWNVLVRGDSTSSTVKATVRFVRLGMARGMSTATITEECSTRGTWETAFESNVKTRAEARR